MPKNSYDVRPALLALTCAFAACSNQAASTAASPAPGDWPVYNRNLSGNRYSPLAQITTANAASIKQVCTTKVKEVGSFQTGPLAIGGTLYLTSAHDTYAINGATCALVWENDYTSAGPEPFPVDRGVAWDGGSRLIRGEPDGHLIAIDTSSGKTLWDIAPASGARGEFLSSAPIIWNGVAYIGTAGSDWGVKGRMMAFDVTNGRQKWTFTTVASGNDPGATSWSVRAAETGGGGMWTSYALDPQANDLFVSVANPAPDFAPGYRPGSNLYTDSEVVLDSNTGALKWYYQTIPNDSHDWDLSTGADLVSASGKSIAAVASKDGYLYVFDRMAHTLLWKTPEVRRQNVDARPTVAGVFICPGALGGAEWNGAAWDPAHAQFITPMDDWCATVKLGSTRYTTGQFYFGGSSESTPFSEARGTLTATDALTGRINWQYHSRSPMLAGVTPTATGVTFTGDMAGNILVFESKSGKLLFKDHTPGSIAGGVITYEVNGKQYVAATSGNISRLTWGAQGVPAIVVYSL